jgi:arylsulfatase A-like enzyme
MGALGALALAQRTRSAEHDTSRPNIVFVLADDLGYADLSCYGAPQIRTPALDGLAARGARFLQAYANSAVCSATRTALITGRYQYRLPVGLEEPLGPRSPHNAGLPPSHPTLPSLLRARGYGTTLIGKWHLGALPDFGPLQSGYDHFFGLRGGGVDYYSHRDAGKQADLWDDDTPVERQGYLTELLGQRAVEVVTAYARARQPFFLSLHFNAPHWPWEAPGDEAESRRLANRSLMDFDGGSQRTYRGMVEALDKQVERLLRCLNQNRLTDNTLIVFTSDNGGERFSNTWPFTGKKTELLEGGLRVPAIASWPGRIPHGVTRQQVMISMDWFPTLLEAAGAAPDPHYPADGMSLIASLTREAPAVPRKLFWRYKANTQRAARDGDYKILQIGRNTFLFNVVEDPLERANLKERHPEVYQQLAAEWNAWNQSMLPETRENSTFAFSAAELADHFGAAPAGAEPDTGAPWPAVQPTDSD